MHEHPIRWNDHNVARLWNYYSRTEPYSNLYFSKMFGGRILLNSGLPLREKISVLDFGCGPGFLWEHMLRLGARWKYTGADSSPESIRSLASAASGHPQFGGALLVDKLPTKLEPQSFDVVLLLEVVEHLTDDRLDATLREVRRLLRTGGVVLVTTPNREDLALSTKLCPDCGAIFHEWQHVRSWDAESLSSWVEDRGFTRLFARSIDFTEHGVKGRIIAVARRFVNGLKDRPHLIASFRTSQ